jgi:hypothetical protein
MILFYNLGIISTTKKLLKRDKGRKNPNFDENCLNMYKIFEKT